MTQADINNLLFFLKRVPTEGLEEATILVNLAAKLAAMHQELSNAKDSPRTPE